MKLYKLTDAEDRTRGFTLWGEGVTHIADTTLKPALCTAGVIHAYRSLRLAMLMNPAHGNFACPLGWEARGDPVADDGTKVGCRSLTTIRRVELPVLTTEQCVEFGIRVTLALHAIPDAWEEWASRWLSGEDRSRRAAQFAASIAEFAPSHVRSYIFSSMYHAARAAIGDLSIVRAEAEAASATSYAALAVDVVAAYDSKAMTDFRTRVHAISEAL